MKNLKWFNGMTIDLGAIVYKEDGWHLINLDTFTIVAKFTVKRERPQ